MYMPALKFSHSSEAFNSLISSLRDVGVLITITISSYYKGFRSDRAGHSKR